MPSVVGAGVGVALKSLGPITLWVFVFSMEMGPAWHAKRLSAKEATRNFWIMTVLLRT
jgi:hypothetical protein